MTDFNLAFQNNLTFFEKALENQLNKMIDKAPIEIVDAVKYSILNGGKRVRPVLMLFTSQMLGLSIDSVINYAMALEMIHSYSLVHDDLPSMDNDDYRRGKLSTHKKFGEANGILAGDALLNLAIETATDKMEFSSLDGQAVHQLFTLSGCQGMIAGQVLDLKYEKADDYDYKILEQIYINKTSKLIIASLVIPSILSGKKYYNELYRVGELIGVLFQITDDILDVTTSFSELGKTPNKDQKVDKLTSIKIFGLEGAKKKAESIYLQAKDILSGMPNAEYLLNFLDKIFLRKK